MSNQASFNVTAGDPPLAAWGDSVGQHLVTTETATPATVFEGKQWVRTDTNEFLNYTGSAAEPIGGYGAYASYTPVFTAATSGNFPASWTKTGGYRYLTGRTVMWWAKAVQTAPSGQTGFVYVSTPTSIAQHVMGDGHYTDSGFGYYDIRLLPYTSSAYYIMVQASGGSYVSWANMELAGGIPTVNVSGDEIFVSGTYESTG